MIPSSRPTFLKASSANCSSSRVCVAVTMVRTRALSRATVGKRDALREDALLEQPIRQLHRQRAVADDDRRDRALADAGVEAERLQARLEEARVLPEPVDDLRLLQQQVDAPPGTWPSPTADATSRTGTAARGGRGTRSGRAMPAT